MKKTRPVIALKGIIFTALVVAAFFIINLINLPKNWYGNTNWPTTSSYRQFYRMKKDSIDVLFLGSSVVVSAFCPQEIYNAYGIRSYNLGCEQQSPYMSYYWLKEALSYQSPRAVVLDTHFLFVNDESDEVNMPEGLIRKCLDPMRPSAVKDEAVRDYCERNREESYLSFYLTNIRFHTRWKDLTEDDFELQNINHAELKGYGAIISLPDEASLSYQPFTPGEKDEDKDPEGKAGAAGDTEEPVYEEMVPIAGEYLDRMRELCSEHGIQLILISLPTGKMTDGINNTVTAYADKWGLSYYNFCEKSFYALLDIDPATETCADRADHANVWGSLKISRRMGEILKEECGIPAVKDAQWEKTKAYFEGLLSSADLMRTEDIDTYLAALKEGKDRYTVFISARGDAFAGLTDKSLEDLKALGIRSDLLSHRGESCYVVIDRGSVQEEVSPEPLSKRGSIRNHMVPYFLVSGGSIAGAANSIIIDGTEYTKAKDGLNIAVYDNVIRRVVDAVNFDTSGSAQEAYR